MTNDTLNIDHLYDEVLFDIPNHKVCAKNSSEFECLVLTTSIDENQHTLLNNILKACSFDIDKDVLFLQVDEEPFTIQSLLELSVIKVLCFGDQSKLMTGALQIERNMPTMFFQKSWILSNALTELENEKELKKALWKALQVWKEERS